jgi:ABC-2 type transport system ATP-binding protein
MATPAIRVQNLVKNYGPVLAVDNVNFEVKPGELVGFLGPNGAGKSTTMKILTTYLPASSGYAWLAGYDVMYQSMDVRRHIGYLPESVPLYPEMRVREYLAYRARLKGVERSGRTARIDYCVEKCRIREVKNRLLGTLSKGYRQRVGLAETMVHRPEILILDEPTVGLDPNQIRDVRALVRTLARDATVLLSTHILSEVEALAARVIILHHGRVVATRADKPQDGAAARVIVRTRNEDRERALGTFAGLPAVGAVAELADGRLAITPRASEAGGADLAEEVFRAAAAAGLALRELGRESSSLEEIFARITTGRADTPDA